MRWKESNIKPFRKWYKTFAFLPVWLEDINEWCWLERYWEYRRVEHVVLGIPNVWVVVQRSAVPELHFDPLDQLRNAP